MTVNGLQTAMKFCYKEDFKKKRKLQYYTEKSETTYSQQSN